MSHMISVQCGKIHSLCGCLLFFFSSISMRWKNLPCNLRKSNIHSSLLRVPTLESRIHLSGCPQLILSFLCFCLGVTLCGIQKATPGSVLKIYSWQCSGEPYAIAESWIMVIHTPVKHLNLCTILSLRLLSSVKSCRSTSLCHHSS